MNSCEAMYAPIEYTQLKSCESAIPYLVERTGTGHPAT